MKQILVFSLFYCLPVVFSSHDSEGSKCVRPLDGLRARYLPDRNGDRFVGLPRTTKCPEIKKYVKVKVNWDIPVTVYCLPKDPRLCIMYDYNGYAAGIQISFLFKDVKIAKKYDHGAVGYVYSDIFDLPAWAFRAYFTNPENLTSDGRKNVKEVAEGLWVYLNGTLTEIPRREKKCKLKSLSFTKQSCIPQNGLTYLYNFNETVPCEELYTFYVKYDIGNLVGFGMASFGIESVGKREWYEKFPSDILMAHTPFSPPCLKEWLAKYGIQTLSIFLVDEPEDISCPYDSVYAGIAQ